MAAAIISGLVSKGFDKQKIHVSEPWDVNRNKMAELGVKTTTSNLEAASGADVLIVAVKPQVAKTVCQELAGAWSSSSAAANLPLLVSIAAGITSESLRAWSTTSAGKAPPVVRVMPNTPALVGEGASGLYAAGDVSAEQKELVSALMSSVSKATEWVDREELLDVVTGLSGEKRRKPLPYSTLFICLTTLDAQQVPARRTSSPSWSTWSRARRASASPRSRRRGWPSRRASAPARPCSSRPRRPPSCARTSPAPTAPPRPPLRASRRPAWRVSSTGRWRRPPRGARSSGGRSPSRRARSPAARFSTPPTPFARAGLLLAYGYLASNRS